MFGYSAPVLPELLRGQLVKGPLQGYWVPVPTQWLTEG